MRCVGKIRNVVCKEGKEKSGDERIGKTGLYIHGERNIVSLETNLLLYHFL